jgi:hypothetical protein
MEGEKIKEAHNIYTMFKNSLINDVLSSEKTQFLKEELIPNFLLKLSNFSMNTIKESKSNFIQASLELEIEEEPQLYLNIKEGNEFIPIIPVYKDATVAAIDVSSIKIGEIESGVICAIRGAIVWRKGKEINFFRCGPLLFHVTDFIIEHLYNNGSREALLESPVGVISRFRSILERFIQGSICNYFKDSIILFDGSLTAGTPDNPVNNLNQILSKARENRNAVLAISKTTKIGFSGVKLSELLKNLKGPCLLDIDENVRALFPSYPVQLLGRVYAVKLSPKGLSFRLDIDKNLSFKDSMDSLGKLIVNDVIDQGYPDTLRLAHILSSFTANDVIGIQRFLSKKFKLQIIPKLNLRRMLFGPFGKLTEAS